MIQLRQRRCSFEMPDTITPLHLNGFGAADIAPATILKRSLVESVGIEPTSHPEDESLILVWREREIDHSQA